MARTPVNHEEKKAQIIQAALSTFAEYGYEETTNKRIAEKIGSLNGSEGKPVSPALIYHYFPNGKGQLYDECIRQFPPLQRFAGVIRANLDQPPEIFLRVVARTYNQVLKEGELMPYMRLVISEGPRHPELTSAMLINIAPALLFPLLGYFEQPPYGGNLSGVKPDVAILQLMGPILVRRVLLATIPEGLLPFEVTGDEEFLETIVQNVLHSCLKD